MHLFLQRPAWWTLLSVTAWLALVPPTAQAQEGAGEIRVVQLQGTMEISTDRGARWIRTQTDQVVRVGDRLRTGPSSRATLRWADNTTWRMRAQSEVEILPLARPRAQPGLHIFKGILSFVHRGDPGSTRATSRDADAGVEGTEFVIAVDVAGEPPGTTISVIDGVVRFTNALGALPLTNGQQAVAAPGAAPARTAGFLANNLLQWALYYPAVLDPGELPFTPAEQTALAPSLAAYRQGDLLAALAAYGLRQPGSEAERVYQAALLLSVGEVEQAEAALGQIEQANASERGRRLASALRRQIAAVRLESALPSGPPELTTELLAASYYEQSRAGGDATLNRALDFAKRAATNSPLFGFASARVAELEFSFGRTAQASAALEQSLAVAPRNAQAVALQGFLLAAQNQPREATARFDEAITLDAALGNAWLGRGLCRIRRGDAAGGREDLLIAASLEPRRAQLRSYLGKAFGDAGNKVRALHELELAQGLDEKDPTVWLYSALLKADHNRINEAIRDLEQAQALNDNRSVYRSRFLLDQDEAVQSANLARIYGDAGLTEWSLSEAGRAVSADYGNHAAHLFLANSYDAMRDPNRINLRYDSVAESEYLIANLLAPVGGGLLAQSVSQQEYSRLFEKDRVGVTASAEYLSRGTWTEQGAVHATYQNSAFLLEGLYRSDAGQERNGDVEETELRLHLKQALTRQDSLYFRVGTDEVEGGDRSPRYDPELRYDQGGPNLKLRTRETQEPTLALGYHREWAPGSHTLLLGGRFDDTYQVADPQAYIIIKGVSAGNLLGVRPVNIEQFSRTRLELYTAEAQQIWQTPLQSAVIGGRFQSGNFRIQNANVNPSDLVGIFSEQGTFQDIRVGFERWSVYGYESLHLGDHLLLVGGISYDWLRYPENFRATPFSEREKKIDKILPKAGLVWSPTAGSAVRAAYTQSLGGAGVDQGLSLEPTHVAGINQSFRSLIPEAIAGANAGAQFETYSFSWEQRLATETYFGLAGQWLNSKVPRHFGAYTLDVSVSDFVFPSRIRENLDYEERSLLVSLDQLVADEWVFGARYRLSEATLEDEFPEVTPTTATYAPFHARQRQSALLHDLKLHVIYNHPSGFFGQFQTRWHGQQNGGYSGTRPDTELWQFDVFAGYRFPRRKMQLTVGMLNLTDQNYHLNPLNYHQALPRERTFLARLQFDF